MVIKNDVKQPVATLF